MFLQTCLGFAESMNMRSIAFPAVGTGFHKFPPDVVAKEMFNEIGTFSRSSLTNIEFVICHRNNHVIEVSFCYTIIISYTRKKNFIISTYNCILLLPYSISMDSFLCKYLYKLEIPKIEIIVCNRTLFVLNSYENL